MPAFTRRSSLTGIAIGLGSIGAAQANAGIAGAAAGRIDNLPTVHALRGASPPTQQDAAMVFVLGYHAPDQQEGGGLFLWSPRSDAPDNGGTVFKPAAQADGVSGRWLRVFDGSINVKWFGARGDGKTDDTAALQRAIDATCAGGALFFPSGQYLVTTLDTRRGETSWHFDHAELVGGATVATACILRMRGLHSRFFDIKINVNFNDNYACGLWWYNAEAASQFNEFYGLEIRYAHHGLIYGEMPGNKTTNFAQSENAILGFRSRGVENPIYNNHENGVLFLVAPQLVAHDEEWERSRPGTFNNRDNRAFQAIAGTLVIAGGEIQNSIAAVTSDCARVEGGEVYLDGCIIEVSAPFRVRGRLTIRGGRILNTQSMTSQFVLQQDLAGEAALRVSDCQMLRNPDVGSFSDRSLVAAPDALDRAEVVFSNCDIIEWAKFTPLIDGNNDRVHLDRCRWRPQGRSGEAYLLDTGAPNLLEGRGIDRAGRSLEGFRVCGIAAGAATLSPDVPNASYSRSMAIRTAGTAGLFTADVASPAAARQSGIAVRAGDRFLVEAWVRRASGRNAALSVLLLDAEGRVIPSGSDGFLVVCDTHQNFVTERWRYLRHIVEIPAGPAAFAGFGGHAAEGEIRFCGLQVRRADLR